MITIEEAKKAMDEMMAQGTSEDEMLGILYLMFQADKISLDELESLIGALGYEFTEEFMNMTPEQQKTDGYEFEDEAEEGVTDEQIEDAKETKEDEVQTDGAEGNKTDSEDEGQNQHSGDEGQDSNEKPENQDQGNNEDNKKEDVEAEERAKARKIYGFDK